MLVMRTLLLSIAGILCMLLHGTAVVYGMKVETRQYGNYVETIYQVRRWQDCIGAGLNASDTERISFKFLSGYFQNRGIPSIENINDEAACCVGSLPKTHRVDSTYCYFCFEKGQSSLYYYIFSPWTIAAHQARALPHWSYYRRSVLLGGAIMLAEQLHLLPYLSRMRRLPLYLVTAFCTYKYIRYTLEKRKMDSELCYLGGTGESWSTAIGNRPIWNFYALKDLMSDKSTNQCDYYCVSATNFPDWMCNPLSDEHQ